MLATAVFLASISVTIIAAQASWLMGALLGDTRGAAGWSIVFLGVVASVLLTVQVA